MQGGRLQLASMLQVCCCVFAARWLISEESCRRPGILNISDGTECDLPFNNVSQEHSGSISKGEESDAYDAEE